MRKVYLEALPKVRSGKNIGKIDWQMSVGMEVKFIYDDIEGYITIVGMTNKRPRKLIIEYNNVIFYDKPIMSGHFSACKLGVYLGKITKDFKFKIGDNFNDEKRNLTIIGMEIRQISNGADRKYYNYKCNECDNIDWKMESNLIKGDGCNICNGEKCVLGINTIWDTDRWMVDLGVSEEDAKTHRSQSNKSINVKCPYCHSEKNKNIYDIHRNKSIACVCGDGFSYPEKFMYSVLTQLNLEFEMQYSPNYLKLNGSQKRSDFYIPSLNLVIETDGGMGHEGGNIHTKSIRTIEECVNDDKWKDDQHLKHGVKTIRINCFKSEMEYIKNNILNSDIVTFVNLNIVNFGEADLYAINSNKIKEVCNSWNCKEKGISIKIIACKYGLSTTTIRNYLKSGSKLQWCTYNAEEEFERSKYKGNKVIILKDGKIYSDIIFESCIELERRSMELFGVKLNNTHIGSVCRGNMDNYKGFTFEYIKEEHKEVS